MKKYIVQTKHAIDSTWNDAEFVECVNFRAACELAGKEEVKYNNKEGNKDPQSPNWVQVRVVPRSRDQDCIGV